MNDKALSRPSGDPANLAIEPESLSLDKKRPAPILDLLARVDAWDTAKGQALALIQSGLRAGSMGLFSIDASAKQKWLAQERAAAANGGMPPASWAGWRIDSAMAKNVGVGSNIIIEGAQEVGAPFSLADGSVVREFEARCILKVQANADRSAFDGIFGVSASAARVHRVNGVYIGPDAQRKALEDAARLAAQQGDVVRAMAIFDEFQASFSSPADAADLAQACLFAISGDQAPLAAMRDRFASITVESSSDAGGGALIWAARTGNAQVVKALLASKADARATGQQGFNALISAVVANSAECVRLLAGASDANHRDEGGNHALIWAAAQAADGLDCLAILAPLSDISLLDALGQGALGWAVDKNCPLAIETLLGRCSPTDVFHAPPQSLSALGKAQENARQGRPEALRAFGPWLARQDALQIEGALAPCASSPSLGAPDGAEAGSQGAKLANRRI